MTDADKKQKRLEIIGLYQEAIREYRKVMICALEKARLEFEVHRERLQAKKVVALAALEREGKLP